MTEVSRDQRPGKVTRDIEDAGGAYKAGLKKARLLRQVEYHEFVKRLSSYLARRGYGAEAVNSVTIRLWHETTGKKDKK